MSEFQTKYFGQLLAEFAKKEYETIDKLAEVLGSSNLSNYTSGKREPRASFLFKLHKLGVNINWLLTGRGEMLMNDEAPISTSGVSKTTLEEIQERIKTLESLSFRQGEKIANLEQANWGLAQTNKELEQENEQLRVEVSESVATHKAVAKLKKDKGKK